MKMRVYVLRKTFMATLSNGDVSEYSGAGVVGPAVRYIAGLLSVCMYMYVCVYVCCAYAWVYMYRCVCVCVFIYVCMYT
jgi:hypothetical protein